MTIQVDGDRTVRPGFSIRVTDWNLNVIIGCGMCTSSEDAGKSTPREVVHRCLARPTAEGTSKGLTAPERVWRLRVRMNLIRYAQKDEESKKTRIPGREPYERPLWPHAKVSKNAATYMKETRIRNVIINVRAGI